jgi:hypothetical protein
MAWDWSFAKSLFEFVYDDLPEPPLSHQWLAVLIAAFCVLSLMLFFVRQWGWSFVVLKADYFWFAIPVIIGSLLLLLF